MEAVGDAQPVRVRVSTVEALPDQVRATGRRLAHSQPQIAAPVQPISRAPGMARQDDRAPVVLQPVATRVPGMDGITGGEGFTIPTDGEEGGGTIIATGTTVVGTGASG